MNGRGVLAAAVTFAVMVPMNGTVIGQQRKPGGQPRPAPRSQPAEAESERPRERSGPLRRPVERSDADGSTGAAHVGRGSESPGPDDRGPALQPEEIDQFLAFTREHFPEVHDQLARVQQADPREFRQMLRRIGPPMMRLMRVSRDNPAEAEKLIRIQKLEMQIRDLGQHHRAAKSEEERTAIRAEAHRLIEQKFALRQEHLKSQVEDLHRRLDEQSKHLADQDQRKQQILDDEFKRLFESPRPGPRAARPRGLASSQPSGR